MNEMLTTGQAARILGVSENQVRKWARAGVLGFESTPLGRLFDAAAVEALRATRQAKREAVA